MLLTVGAGLALPRPAAAQGVTPPQGERVDPQVLETLAASGSADFVIEMAEQADLSAAYAISDWNERGQYVVDTLKATAERSQKDAIGQLNRQGARFMSYFVSNVIVVRGGNQHALDAFQNLPGVARVRAPVVVRLEPVEELLRRAVEIKLPQAILAGTPTWGLTDTKAPDFWSAFGSQGQGIIVANIDSGVQYDHPALAGAYQCASGNAEDPKCWLNTVPDIESCPVGVPCDDNGHGTHTMGTMVGTDQLVSGPSVGMAPGAKWIACRAFTKTGNGDDSNIIACAQWLLAPGGSAANRPHVINNSWGGETTASDSWFRSYVQAWRAAGMFPVFSAGNNGSGCTTLGSPADYPEGFAVAAHDSSRNIAWFSSRGPITFGVMPYTKPNLSAPGVDIYSSVPINSYNGTYSGTSMAAPHVSGAVALLWSCNPGLVGQIDQTFQLLQNSAGIPPAGSCGAPTSGNGNYTYGYGYLNVFQAGVGICSDWHNTFLPLVMKNYGGSVPPNPVQNGGFESGQVAWDEVYTGNIGLILNTSFDLPLPPHGGSWLTWLGGVYDEVSSISQNVTVPVGRSILHYWFASGSEDVCGYDEFSISAGGTQLVSEWICSTNETNNWIHRTLDLTAYAGTTQTIRFMVSTDGSLNSNVFLDDISFETSTALSGSAVNGSSDPLPVDGSASKRLKTSKQD